MPQRTNSFQKLVALIHRALNGSGVRVQESAMIPIPGLGDLREIDVLVETTASSYKIKIAVEAKDHKRKLSVTDIEAIVSKYRGAGGLIVDKVVVVCQSGYSKLAMKKAALSGIELLTLSESTNKDWTALAAFAPGQKLVLSLLPHIRDISISPALPSDLPCALCQGLIVKVETGKEIDSPKDYVQKVVANHLLRSPQLRRQFDFARKQKTEVPLSFDMETFAIRLAGHDFPLNRISFILFWADKTAPLEFHSYDLEDSSKAKRTMQHGVAHFPGHTYEILLPQGLASTNVALRLTKQK